MKAPLLFIPLFSLITINWAQAQQNDSVKTAELGEVIITEYKAPGGIERMPDLKENVIYTGKKTEVIRLDRINADLSTNNTRQVFAKVPGMSVWENDGSGIQAGVATRGLSPNRSWEFNVRQNGYDISSEVFGYPEAYYTPPMEALEKIEVVRGAASLQYGPQFGGLLNYCIKKADPGKPVTFETQQTIGSYGLFNSYNALGGTYKTFRCYGFFHHRASAGWRDNSNYNIYSGYLSASWQVTPKLLAESEYTNMDYQSRQPGGLTDTQFNIDNRQSSRERNWLGAPFHAASLTFKYSISPSIQIQMRSFTVMAERNSVGYVKSITTPDSINPVTLQYNARQVDRDKYRNYGTEIRLSVKYRFLGRESVAAGGTRLYSGNTWRNQLGRGTTGHDFDLTLTNPKYGRSLEFGTTNLAAFAENIFRISKRFSMVPGIRYEYISNESTGYIDTTQAGALTPGKRARTILLYGAGSEFKVTEKTGLYGNYSLAYRPVTFSEITPSATTEIIDPELKDASGFNADFGYRGTVKNFLNFDVGVFYLRYDNRSGLIMQNGALFRTNIGTSASKGFESYIELNILQLMAPKSKAGNLSVYASNAFVDAEYVKWNNPSIANDPAKSIENKRVENAPRHIHRLGATYSLKGFSATFQFSSVGDVYTDAANTETPNATGTIGRIPGYQIADASMCYQFSKHYNVKAGINNIADVKYATRRAGGYPGPGLLPGNGRTVFLSVGAAF